MGAGSAIGVVSAAGAANGALLASGLAAGGLASSSLVASSGVATSLAAGAASVTSASVAGGSFVLSALALAKVAAVATLLAGGVYLGAQSKLADVAASDPSVVLANAGNGSERNGLRDGQSLAGARGNDTQNESDARLAPKPDLPSAPHSLAGQFSGVETPPDVRADADSNERSALGRSSDLQGRVRARGADAFESEGADARLGKLNRGGPSRSGRGASAKSLAESKGASAAGEAQKVNLADEESSHATATELAGRLGQELQLIQRARRQLRAHDLQAALTTLRLHIELYPDGELTPEANRLRLQAQREMAADD